MLRASREAPFACSARGSSKRCRLSSILACEDVAGAANTRPGKWGAPKRQPNAISGGTRRAARLAQATAPSMRVKLARNRRAPARTPDGSFACITTQQPNALVSVDGFSGARLGSAPVGPNPERVALTPDGLFAYVTNRGN